MTIDEVIQIEKYCGKKDQKVLEELQKEFPMIKGIKDNNLHEQIAEWLEELKEARKCFEENRKAGYKHGYSDGYNKAINDVIKSIDDICDTERDRCNDFGCCSDCYKSGIKEIAEQLKR